MEMILSLMRPFLGFISFFYLFVCLSSSIPAHSYPVQSFKPISGQENLSAWMNGILSAGGAAAQAQAPGPSNQEGTLVLAENRTARPDILSGFRKYRGGWDIADKHYWASVGFTGAVGFILGVLWFLFFGLALVIYGCCGWRIDINGRKSNWSLKLCLILLIIFTCAAVIGGILLSVGQVKFHNEASQTLKFVVNQSDYTVQTLRNVTAYMSLAESVSVAQVFLPSDVKDDIDRLNVDLNNAADTLESKTNESSGKIKRVFNIVRSAMIGVAVVMLLVSLLGLVVSILGHPHAIYVFVISGWLLVAVTFILCGVFVILNSVISDTCVAMVEWADNPQAETAFSNILPCVDQSTTNQTLLKSKQVENNIVGIVNRFVDSYANLNPSPQDRNYYNQSGPYMPRLCYPYDGDYRDRQCTDQEVSLANASTVWESYVCGVSLLLPGVCSSTGRMTPDMYSQLVAAVNISYALQHYTPPLLNLQNCNFVRDTFENISARYCPPLKHYVGVVNIGLGLISVGVMLSLALWLLYANRPPSREEAFAKLPPRINNGSFSGGGGGDSLGDSVSSTAPLGGV